ncbi:MAG: hypothetical protein OEW19_08310 [Acidobacteriota bacterium]|nr:hypothetical protein [Acidobacteriota bacterium]
MAQHIRQHVNLIVVPPVVDVPTVAPRSDRTAATTSRRPAISLAVRHQSFPALPPSRVVPTSDVFWHPSQLRGQAHVSRVMVHAIRLVDATGQHALAPRLWAAVFLHDLARRHDGVCHHHGADTAGRVAARRGAALRC